MLKTRDIVLLRTRTYEKVFDTKDFEFGRTAPPFHPNCRTTTIPVVEGIEDTAGRASRNPETGKTEIVENLTYKEWKDKYLLKIIDREYNISEPIETQSDEAIRDWIKDHKKELNHDKYEEHDKNSKGYDGEKSYLTITEEEVQK